MELYIWRDEHYDWEATACPRCGAVLKYGEEVHAGDMDHVGDVCQCTNWKCSRIWLTADGDELPTKEAD